jgi:hypothetical protein
MVWRNPSASSTVTEALEYLPDERLGITLARAKSEKYLEIATQEV